MREKSVMRPSGIQLNNDRWCVAVGEWRHLPRHGGGAGAAGARLRIPEGY